jgi:hypothetical protein
MAEPKNNESSNLGRFPSPPRGHTAATLNTMLSLRLVLRWQMMQVTMNVIYKYYKYEMMNNNNQIN